MTHIPNALCQLMAAGVAAVAAFIWPDTANYAVEFKRGASYGKQKYTAIAFFETREEMDKWMVTALGWLDHPGNTIAFRSWEWRNGPLRMEGFCCNDELLDPAV